jgi:hypothetical protein
VTPLRGLFALAVVFALAVAPHGAGAQEPPPSPAPTAGTPAAIVPQTLAITLTGDPADAPFVQAQVTAALDRAIRPTLQPGATLSYGDLRPAPQPLASGFVTTYTVPVSVNGGQQFPSFVSSVDVQVQNLAVPPLVPTLLALDDDPEYVQTDGVLFRTTVAQPNPTRVYYYHANTAQPRRFLLAVSSAGDEPSRVQVIDASAGPNPDVMSVGHAVSRAFVELEPRGQGTVADVTASAPFFERDASLGQADGVAGAVDVRVLSGPPVTVAVLAIPAGAPPAAYLQQPKVANDGHNRHGTFALGGFGEATIAYTLGGPEASVLYGDRAHAPPNVDPNDAGRDAGDYGAIHRLTFDVANPTNASATVYLYEEPIGGVVRNTFVVNGNVVEMGCARLSQRYQIGQYTVDPRGTAALSLVTMTDGGSNYPLEVGVTATPPLPTTPPISAPDGCFPKPGASPAPVESPSPIATPTEEPT